MVLTLEALDFTYKKLMAKYKEIKILESTEAIIKWDMETKMPPKGINQRSEQLAMLSSIKHKMITAPVIGILLKKIERNQDHLDEIKKRNIYLIRKNYNEQTKIPVDIVRKIAKQRALTIDSWKKAKISNNFSIFQPQLEKLFKLKKKVADILMNVKKTDSPYDALIDFYEPNITSKAITKIFNNLKVGLLSLIEKCHIVQKKQTTSILKRRIPLDIQRRISNSIAKYLEYDVNSDKAGGRIDETEHPFTIGYYDDVRVTTHYYEDNFKSSIFSMLHECGHAIYKQNIKPEWRYQPVGAACSTGFHESQSRFIENIVGRSKDFWIYFLPKLKEIVGKLLSDVDLEAFVFNINLVKPSKIRVDADEVTYCIHIITRFEIESDLMNNRITVSDLPEVWNKKYKDYLNVDVKNDSEGVLQDTHWASGHIGYFPTYALGNIYSGQILSQIEKDIPDWKSQIANGKFNNVKKWLIENIYSYGNLYDPSELIKKISGEEIKIKPYSNYLNEKYSRLYGF